jgi:hypothetical protein
MKNIFKAQKMTKAILVLALVALTAAVFGQQNFTVEEVKGRAEKMISAGKWESIAAGDTLGPDDTVRTAVGASLTVKYGGKSYVIGSARNDLLAKLTTDQGGGRIRIGGKVATTDTGEAERNTTRVGTASARASEAAGDRDTAAE